MNRVVRAAAPALVAILAIACSPVTTPPPTAAAAPVVVSGQASTGASAPFRLAAGSYHVAWVTTASEASCAFYLYLSTTRGGPTVKDIEISIMPEAQDYSGTADWSGVSAGSYVLQEDRSGLLNCTGPWNATLTPE